MVEKFLTIDNISENPYNRLRYLYSYKIEGFNRRGFTYNWGGP